MSPTPDLEWSPSSTPSAPRSNGIRISMRSSPVGSSSVTLTGGGIPSLTSMPTKPSRGQFVFRHKLLRFLRDRDLISEQRIDLLLSWRHSGFSVHNHTTVYPSDTEGLYRLACYLHRAPVNLSRLRYHPQSGLLIYEPKAGIIWRSEIARNSRNIVYGAQPPLNACPFKDTLLLCLEPRERPSTPHCRPGGDAFLPHNVFDQIPNALRAKNLLQSSRPTDCSSG